MIPLKMKPYFETCFQSNDGENHYIVGDLVCCQNHAFKLKTNAKVKNGLFFKLRLFPKEEGIVLKASCNSCGKTVPVFDSGCDGYARCEKKVASPTKTDTVICKKCHSSDFSLSIKYEYPSTEELKALDIPETDNAFTWIWGTFRCNGCGTIYKNALNLETD